MQNGMAFCERANDNDELRINLGVNSNRKLIGWNPDSTECTETTEMRIVRSDNGDEFGIVKPGYKVISWSDIYTPPRLSECDCGGDHSPAECPNAIIHWDGWQA